MWVWDFYKYYCTFLSLLHFCIKKYPSTCFLCKMVAGKPRAINNINILKGLGQEMTIFGRSMKSSRRLFCTFAYGFIFSSVLFQEENKYKILLASAKTLTNSKNGSLKSQQNLFQLSFSLIGRISWSQPAFGTILRFICTKHVEGGYW
jgi:hypothetical protein